MSKVQFRMSEVGQCPVALAAPHLGFVPDAVPEWFQRAAVEGSRHESWIVEDLRAQGMAVMTQGDCPTCPGRKGIHVAIEELLFILTGHLDGRVEGSVLEVKALGESSFYQYEHFGIGSFPTYESQLTCYMQAAGAPAVYVVKNRNSGRILKTLYGEPPKSYEEIKTKLNLVVAKIIVKELPDPAPGINCGPCVWKKVCKIPQEVLPTRLVEMVDFCNEARPQVDRYFSFREAIRDILSSRGVFTVTVGETQLRLFHRKRTYYSVAKLEREVPKELLQKCKETTKFTELRMERD